MRGAFLNPGQVYVQGLAPDATVEEVSNFFGEVGLISADHPVVLFRDSEGYCKGDAIVTFEDADSAAEAVNLRSGKEFRPGYTVHVSLSRPGEDGAAASTEASSAEAAAPAPAAPAPEVRPSEHSGEASLSRPARERRPGDWDCACGEHNYSYRRDCFKCRAPRPPNPDGSEPEIAMPDVKSLRPGDWKCTCGVLNYSWRMKCMACRGPRPANAPPPPIEAPSRPGDWNCPSCTMLNYAFRTECKRCRTLKPAEGGYGGYGAPGGYGGYGAPGGYGGGSGYASGAYGAPGGYGAGGSYGAPSAYGTTGSYGGSGYASGAYGAPGSSYGAPSAGAAPGGYGSYGAGGYGGGYGAGGGYGSSSIPPPPPASAGGAPPREGDWTCPNPACRDNVWARRDTCRRCGTRKPEGAGGSAAAYASAGGFQRSRSRSAERR